jgi:hypothetical protein
MDLKTITIAMVIVITVFASAILLLPYIVVRFTEPKWALGKSALEFIALMLVLSLFVPSFLSVPGAFTIELFRHRARLARYAARQQQEAEQAHIAETQLFAPDSSDSEVTQLNE